MLKLIATSLVRGLPRKYTLPHTVSLNRNSLSLWKDLMKAQQLLPGPDVVLGHGQILEWRHVVVSASHVTGSWNLSAATLSFFSQDGRHFVHQQWRQGKGCLVFSFDNDSFTVTPTNSGKGSSWDLVKRCLGFLSSPGQPLYVLVLSRCHRLFSLSKQLPFHLILTLLTQSQDKESLARA